MGSRGRRSIGDPRSSLATQLSSRSTCATGDPVSKQQIQARGTRSRGRKQAPVRISRELYVDKVPNARKGTGQGFGGKNVQSFPDLI